MQRRQARESTGFNDRGSYRESKLKHPTIYCNASCYALKLILYLCTVHLMYLLLEPLHFLFVLGLYLSVPHRLLQ